MTLDSWVCQTGDLIANAKRTLIPSTCSWTSQTEWQTWLKMKGRPGGLLWRTDKSLVSRIDELPRAFVERSEKLLPGKLAEPLSWESQARGGGRPPPDSSSATCPQPPSPVPHAA